MRIGVIGGGAWGTALAQVAAANGEPVDAVEDLQAALIDKKQGDTVTLKLWRAGKERDVRVTLDASSFK